MGILCVSSRQDPAGTLPELGDIAIHLRVSEHKAESMMAALTAAGLVDKCKPDNTFAVHGWDKRQFPSDNVTERTRRYKERAKGDTGERSRERSGNGLEQNRERTEQRESGNVAVPVTPHTPSELDSGRTGEDHDLFCRVVQELEGFAETKYLGGQLLMYADTPGVRNYESWRLLVACRVVQRPDKPKSWATFTRSADNATWDEYQRLTKQHAPGASVAGPRKYNVVAGP